MRPTDCEEVEIDTLLHGIRSRYGYDFAHYSRASLKRRLQRALTHTRLTRFSELLDRLFHDDKSFDEFLKIMSISVTAMFRDPEFYQAFRKQVVPLLKTYPFIKIWHAGCATGEEVYSMALLLHEEGFLDRARIYATDFNKHSLDAAANGVYPAKQMEVYAANYRLAGGKSHLSDYYSDGYELAKVKDFLKERITFSYHNLVTDGVFGEMNMICCRNVLIYFDRTLQDQVLAKLSESLRHSGFLCLGNRESLNFTIVRPVFVAVDKAQRIYQKCGV
ncbi:MAG: protein-glutamate O-methyltransferase CheR [Acidobacteriaceae bacterium]